MKPVIAESVYNSLSHLSHPSASYLKENLSNAHIINDESLPKNSITLNSIVEYTSEPSLRPIRIQIVSPEQEDLAKRKVSVLAPISQALLGFKESEDLTVKMISGEKKIKILKVYNH